MENSAPSACLSWLRIIREYTQQQQQQQQCWARILGGQKYRVKRLGTSLRGQARVSQRRLGCLSPRPSEVHSARLFAAAGIGVVVVDVGLNFLSRNVRAVLLSSRVGLVCSLL